MNHEAEKKDTHQFKTKKMKTSQYITLWLVIPSLLIIIGSISIAAFVDYVVNVWVYHNLDYHPIAALGMIFPMEILMGSLYIVFSKLFYSYTAELANAISKIANGEFNVLLEENHGGPLKEVYQNFNLMSKELTGVQTLRNDFINDFSHEFKTPLSSINGFANLLLEGDLSPEREQQYLTIIAKESARLADLTQSQLLLSKIESQQIIVNKTPFSLDEQIRQCVIILSSKWESKQLNLSLELTRITYTGDAALLQHLWLNLLSNAIKYTPDHGDLSISSNIEKEHVQISISDTGIGIPQSELDIIFNKYYQSNPSYATKGLGLGLCIVKRIITLCNGSLQVESSPGSGSTFTVILPR
ncbi:MAG: HAMP domain-containing histidine kinase [Acetobacterium woodii]|nr:HAMP domain-containing histidine kinase [Acetobacterium woodii]